MSAYRKELKVAIYGAGEKGKEILKKMQEEIVNGRIYAVFIDNYIELDQLEGLPIYKEEIFLKKHNDFDAIIMSIDNPSILHQLIALLRKKCRIRIYRCNPKVKKLNIPIINANGELGAWVYECKKPSLDYLEIQVIDVCNVNCRICSHFANIFSDEWRLDSDELIQAIKALKKKFSQIFKIRLIGGEPLLNDKLDEFIPIIKEYFPLSDISIATNGILIPKMSKNLVYVIRKYSVRLYITQYMPTKYKLEEIVRFLEENEIAYHISSLVTEFKARMTMGESDIHKVFFETCTRKSCVFYRKNGLFRCPFIPLAYEKKDYFKIQINNDEIKRERICLMDTNMDGWDILNFFDEPSTLCRFCAEKERAVSWSARKPCREEWFT